MGQRMPGSKIIVSNEINVTEDPPGRVANSNISKNTPTPNLQLPEEITYKHKRNSNTLENFIITG